MKGYRAYANGRVRHLIQCAGVQCIRKRGNGPAKIVWVPLWTLIVVEWLSFQRGVEVRISGMLPRRRWPKSFRKECQEELRRLNSDQDALYAFLAEMVLRFGANFHLGRPAQFALEEGLPS